MKLSVIVPVYNVEKFLPRCLDSLLRQGLEVGEWEVICVNDGSSDNCGVILAEYEIKYPNIFKIITQENQGLGAARNTGMKVAQGEFIGFLDSDDYLVDHAYRYLLDHFCTVEEGDFLLDVLHYNYSEVYTNGTTLHDSDAQPYGEITFDGDGADAYNVFPMICVWTKFYRRQFLVKHNIWFENVINEDELFNFDVFSHHPHLRMVSSNVVRYEKGNTNSIMTTTEKKRVLVHLEDLLYNLQRINQYLEQGGTSIAPAARRTIDSLWGLFHKKITSVFLSWNEWHSLYKKGSTLPPPNEPDGSDCNFRTRLWLMAKKRTRTSFLVYIFFTLGKKCLGSRL